MERDDAIREAKQVLKVAMCQVRDALDEALKVADQARAEAMRIAWSDYSKAEEAALRAFYVAERRAWEEERGVVS